MVLPFILFYAVGTPLVGLFLLYDNRQKPSYDSSRESLNFLYKGFLDKYFYWEIVIAARKLLFIVVQVVVIN